MISLYLFGTHVHFGSLFDGPLYRVVALSTVAPCVQCWSFTDHCNRQPEVTHLYLPTPLVIQYVLRLENRTVRDTVRRGSKKRRQLDFKKITQWKNELFLIIFGAQNPEETSHQVTINVSTSPIKGSSRCTLWKADNVHVIEASTKTRWRYYHLRQIWTELSLLTRTCSQKAE